MSRQARLIVVLVAMAILAVMALGWIAGRYSRILDRSSVAGPFEPVEAPLAAPHA